VRTYDQCIETSGPAKFTGSAIEALSFPTINRRLLMHGSLASWSWRTFLGLFIAGVLAGAPLPARAGMIVSVQSVSANAGTSGNTLEVDLQNTGAPVDIAAFAFEISVTSSSGVTFTGADINTTLNTYIFNGDSAQGPNIGLPSAGPVLDASDNATSGGTTLMTGSTLALGRVFFDVASSAQTGPVIVTLAPFPSTSLTDPNLNPVPIDTLNSGTITILASSTVPEPSGLISLTLGLLSSAWLIRARRRTAS
jgi:hypothetical protein